MKKSGFTLMELLVYIAIVGIIVLVAGQAFSDSTKFRVRTQNMLKAADMANAAGELLKEDIGQLGAKSYQTEEKEFAVESLVYMDADNVDEDKQDFSSFKIVPVSGSYDTDTLIMRRINYDDAGQYQSVEEIKWYMVGQSLTRSCKTLKKLKGDECAEEPIEVASNVATFKVIAATPGVETDQFDTKLSLIPSNDLTETEFRLIPRYGDENYAFVNTEPQEGDVAVTVSGFATNYDAEKGEVNESGKMANQVFVGRKGSDEGNWKNLCKSVNLDANTTYEISFALTYNENGSRMFTPGSDYAGVGLRDNNGAKIKGLDDFYFYPPTSKDEPPQRNFRFNLKQPAKDVCMSFTFAYYSPIANTGAVILRDVSLKRVPQANYQFDENKTITVKDKKNVKALRLYLVVNSKNETGNYTVDIPIAGNGPKD